MKKNSIFVQIASYRDSECKHTINDLFSKAKNPEHVFIGLNWQYADVDEDIPFFDKPYQKNIRILKYEFSTAKGVCWARSLTQSLLEDEEYTLAIDAHMRFVENWDEILINMLKSLQNEGYAKPVITHYPPDYTLDGTYRKDIKKMAPFLRHEDDLFIFRRTGYEVSPGSQPILSGCIAAGFNFTLSQSIKEIPYDQHLYFLGEEITLAARFWTHGYDFFNPAQIIIYHLYKEKRKEDGSIKQNRTVTLHQKDNDAKARNAISKERVKHILGTKISRDANITKDLELYRLGEERTLYQFELFTGLNFQTLTRKVHTRTTTLYQNMIPVGITKETTLLEEFSFREKKFEANEDVIKLLNILNINSILHLSCGGINESLNNLIDIEYTGIDFNDTVIKENNIYYRHKPQINFINLNYIGMPVPKKDSVIIDIDLANTDTNIVWQILHNAIRSQPEYLIILGQECDLVKSPYYFPNADLIIPQDNNLYIWRYPKALYYSDPLDINEAELRIKLLTQIENQLNNINNPSIKETLIKALPVQSRSKVKELVFSDKVEAYCKEHGHANAVINNLIDIRFKILNDKTKKMFPFIKENNSLLVMILICQYCEYRKSLDDF